MSVGDYIFPKIRPIGGVLATVPPAEIHTEAEDTGIGEIRPERPIFIFPASEGDSEPNLAFQAGQALLRIDFAVEMVTPEAIPVPRPMPPITDYILPKRVRFI